MRLVLWRTYDIGLYLIVGCCPRKMAGLREVGPAWPLSALQPPILEGGERGSLQAELRRHTAIKSVIATI